MTVEIVGNNSSKAEGCFSLFKTTKLIKMIWSVSKKLLIILISLVVALAVSISIYVSVSAPKDFDSYKVIETNDGPVRGQLKRTVFNGNPYYAFQGIPYAKPPVGELRFKVSISNRTRSSKLL